MIKSISALAGRLDEELDLFAYCVLADVFFKRLGPEGLLKLRLRRFRVHSRTKLPLLHS
jgi:hypothetical protein